MLAENIAVEVPGGKFVPVFPTPQALATCELVCSASMALSLLLF
jgi:hypothetical protein